MSIDQDDDKVIFWTKDYLLKWDDFLAEPNFQKTAKAESSVGLDVEHEIEYVQTNSKIKFKFKRFTVKAIFQKTKSWKKNDMIKDRIPYVLKHEQGHFDIAQEYESIAYNELFNTFNAKSYSVKGKTQDEIVNTARHISDKMVKVVMDKIFAKYDATQIEYEDETRYGTNDMKQKEYDERFEKLRK